jgi:predicted amidohydrolase YtcJ
MMRCIAAAIALVGFAWAQQSAAPDIVILHARVFTGNAAQPWAEAVAIRGNRIATVGSTSDVRAAAVRATRVIDANGRLLIPGIEDAHLHPDATPPAARLEGPSAIDDDPSLDEVLRRTEAAVAKAPPSGWIAGEIGSVVLADPRATRSTLDRVSGDHPLLLVSWTGHGIIANSAALRALRIDERQADPPGGRFARAADGRITGLAEEYAGFLLRRRFAMLADRSEHIRAFQALARELASLGITSMQAMLTSYTSEDASALLAAADIPLRVRLIDVPHSSMTDWHPASARPTRAPSPPLVSMSGTKWILDGTPVERLMYVAAPFADMPTSRGRLNFSSEDLRVFLQRALNAGDQPILHAGGDAAIRAVLDALEATGGDRWKPLRPRIEHGDMFGPQHFARAARMGVTIVQNPSHFMIAATVRARLGASRAEQMFRVKDIVDAGVPFALGSDGPLNPFVNIMFATINAANPPQALSVEQALAAYTAGSAAAERAEGEKGMLKPGMLADMALLSQDIFEVAPRELPNTMSVLTIVDGRVVHDRMSPP